MPFPHPLTSTQLDLLRDNGNYAATVNLAYCPQTTVFKARVNGGIGSGVFAELDFDTVTVGADTDIRPGMTVYVSATDSIRNAYLTTRVRKTPTSSILYIGESDKVVQDNDYIIVVNDYWLWERLIRIDTAGVIYADYDITFKKDPPQIGNLQSVYIDPRRTGATTIVFSPTGQPMAYDATTSLTWLWDVADGTITVGTTTTQQITATFPQGERWVRCTVTDSNSVSHTRVMWVNVGLTNTLTNIENPPVTGSMEDGYNLSLNTWDFQGATVLRALPESTLCVVYASDTFGDGSTTPIVTNIMYIGRTHSERSHTAGDEEWTTLQTGSFELEGFASQLNRLSSPQWSLIHDATPDTWGYSNRPTVPRFMANYFTWFNTLSALCSLDFEIPFTFRATTVNTDATVTVANTDILVPGMGVSGTGIPGSTTVLSITNATTFELSANATASATNTLVFTPVNSDQRFISQSLTLTDTSAGAAADKAAGWINAKLNYAPTGEIYIRRHAFYLSPADKPARQVVIDIEAADMLEFTLDVEYPDKIGRAFSGFERFNTTLGETIYIAGSAPPVARGNGEGQATEDGQILTADADDSTSITEANIRTGTLYAVSQALDKIEVLFYDSFRGVFAPNAFRMYTFTIASTLNNSGRVYTTAQDWLCISVEYNAILETGEMANKAAFIREPAIGDAQVASAISPAVTEPGLPELPAHSPYPGMELSGGINYPVDGEIDDVDLQPIDSYSQSYGDEETAGNFPPPGCRNLNILMNDDTAVATPSLTNAATYTVRVSGSGQISAAGLTVTDDMTASLGANTHEFSATFPFALWNGSTQSNDGEIGGAWQASGGRGGGGCILSADVGGSPPGAPIEEGGAVIDLVSDRTVTAASFWLIHLVHPGASDEVITFWDASKVLISQHVVSLGNTPTYTQRTWTGSVAGVRYVSFSGVVNSGGSLTIDDLSVTYGSAGEVDADAFYYFDPANPNVGFPYTGYGLTFDGGEPNSIPPYNTNHVYNTTITGGGAPVDVLFSDTDHTDNAAATLRVRICGAGL